MTNDLIRIQYLECACKLADVAGSDDGYIFQVYYDPTLTQVRNFFKTNHFQVQDDFRNILNYTFDRRKFVKHAWELHTRDGVTFQRRKENPTQRITNGYAVSFL